MVTKVERQQERQEWEVRVASFRSSGLSARKWCAANGVKPHQLEYRLKKERMAALDSASVTWLRASVNGFDASITVRVGAAVIEVRPGFDPDLFAGVVRVLSAGC